MLAPSGIWNLGPVIFFFCKSGHSESYLCLYEEVYLQDIVMLSILLRASSVSKVLEVSMRCSNITQSFKEDHRWLTLFVCTESFKYYARIQTAVARGHGLPADRQAGHYTHAASKHSPCYFSSFSQ